MATTGSKVFTKGLEDLFLHGVKDIDCAEKKITKELKMAKAVHSEKLKAGSRRAMQEAA